jgi:hypothetical protein
MIDPNTPIAVSMSAQQWGVVLEALSHAPYRVVAPIFVAIQQQCMEHDAPMRVSGGANGADPHPEP